MTLLRRILYFYPSHALHCCRHVLELGGGMTGLLGLGLAAAASHSPSSSSSSSFCRSITITDGHPSCVANQRVCLELCRQRNVIAREVKVKCEILRWSSQEDMAAILSGPLLSSEAGNKGFDVIVAADCLFFRDFHTSLLSLLNSMLSFKEGAVVYLLQPRRAGSMEAFLSLLTPSSSPEQAFFGRFEADVSDAYDESITAMHRQYMDEMSNSGSSDQSRNYEPDIHFPILITLRRRK